MSQKDRATGFLKMLASNKVREAYEAYIASDFIHHNQYFQGDRQSLMLAMEEAHREFPNTQVDIKHVYECVDTVITHSHVKHRPEDQGFAVVHVFRFRGDKVVEMWDLGQEIMRNSPNQYGPF